MLGKAMFDTYKSWLKISEIAAGIQDDSYAEEVWIRSQIKSNNVLKDLESISEEERAEFNNCMLESV